MTAALLLATSFLLSGTAESGSLQQSGQIAPALRKMLSNGAVCLTQTFPGAKQSSLNIFFSAAGTEDTPEKHGRRHLLEHVAARSVQGLDSFIEGAGGMLVPTTSRDWMRFEIIVPKGLEDIALEAIRRILTPVRISKEIVERERKIIAHESALRRKDELLSAKAWTTLFDDSALDPFGSEKGLDSITPEELEGMWRQMLRGNGIALVAVGDFDLNRTARVLTSIGETLPSGPQQELRARSQSTIATRGDQAFSARIEPIDRPAGVAGVAMGLLAAMQTPDSAAFIQPSPRPSVMTVYSSRSIQKAIETITEDPDCTDPGSLQSALRRWVGSFEGSPSRMAELRGILLLVNPAMSPNDLITMLRQATRSEITLAHERWKAGISL